MAAALAGCGVNPGDRVAIMAEPGAAWAAAFLGVLRRAAVAVPLDPKLTVEELMELRRRSDLTAAMVSATQSARWAAAADSATSVFVATGSTWGRSPTLPGGARQTALDHGIRQHAGEPGIAGAARDCSDVARPLTDPALLVWTSGTTGTPKGVTLSLANLAYVVDAACRAQDTGPSDRWLSVLPPNHLLELCCGLLPALASGSTTFVAATLLPHELLALVSECLISHMVVVPMVLRTLRRHIQGQLEEGVSLGSLRIFCGGAPLDADTEGWFADLGVGLYPGYGLSEASPTVTMNRAGHSRPGSVGQPIPGTEVRLAENREVLVRGPGVMLGYWNDPPSGALPGRGVIVDPYGWLHTGDVGRLDDDGYLYVTGRSKTLIVLDSGKKVQPEEVEMALAPGLRWTQACVVGWRDPHDPGRGEQVCAVVVPATDLDQEAAATEVRRLTSGLSGYKRPTVVRIHPGPLPATAKASVRRAEVLRFLNQPAPNPSAIQPPK